MDKFIKEIVERESVMTSYRIFYNALIEAIRKNWWRPFRVKHLIDDNAPIFEDFAKRSCPTNEWIEKLVSIINEATETEE